MAAKKKPMAKPTRTGAETKSYTSASSRMQAKGKAGQRAASAAQAGKSGMSGRRAIEDQNRQAPKRARKANKVVDPKADIEIRNGAGKVVQKLARHDAVKGKSFSSQDAEDARLAGKRPGAFPSSAGGQYRRDIAYERNLELNPQERYPYRNQSYRAPGEPRNPHGSPYMGPHRDIKNPRSESPSERNEVLRMSAISSKINPSKNTKNKGKKGAK